MLEFRESQLGQLDVPSSSLVHGTDACLGDAFGEFEERRKRRRKCRRSRRETPSTIRNAANRRRRFETHSRRASRRRRSNGRRSENGDGVIPRGDGEAYVASARKSRDGRHSRDGL